MALIVRLGNIDSDVRRIRAIAFHAILLLGLLMAPRVSVAQTAAVHGPAPFLDVYFAAYAVRLSANGRDQISTLVSTTVSNPACLHHNWFVIGHAERNATESEMHATRQRSAYVVELLQRYGVSRSAICHAGSGIAHPIHPAKNGENVVVIEANCPRVPTGPLCRLKPP
jgi:hypothetical protein